MAREPRSLADILADVEALRGYNKRLSNDQLREAWADVAGSWASQSRALQMRGGILHIAVSNPSVLDELSNFRKLDLLNALRERHAHLRVRDIRFKLARASSRPLSDDDLGF